MYRVNILASNNSLFSTVFGPFDMLSQAGIFWNAVRHEPFTPYFDIVITSIDGLDVRAVNGAVIKPQRKIDDDDQYDLIIIPSEGMELSPDTYAFKRRVDYLAKMHAKGAVIASICTGAYLVAATGLLDNKEATTHWAFEGNFKQCYPKVKLNTDLLIVDNLQVITAGGVTADLDLCMHLISRFCGHEVAIQTARCTLVDRTPREQIQYRCFAVEKNHGDDEILRCQLFIDDHLSNDLSIDYLSSMVAMSQRTFSRRFRRATGHSFISYIQQLRVESAKFTLAQENVSFDDIANNLGYENVSFFRRLFKQHVGISPKEYRRIFYRS